MNKSLLKFVERYGTNAAAAEVLGCSPSAVGHWLAGRRQVSLKVALKIEQLTEGEITKESIVFGEQVG